MEQGDEYPVRQRGGPPECPEMNPYLVSTFDDKITFPDNN